MVTDLGNLGGALFSQASAINHRGQVVGASDLSGDTNFFAGPFSNFHGFLWKNGTIRDLGTLAGDVTSFATGINNKGQVVGVGFFGNGQSRAFLWQNGVMTDLNALVPGPPFSPLYLVQANGVNERGEIVGIGLSRTGAQHAFLAVPCDHDDSSNSGCDKNVTVAQAGPPAFDVSHSPNTPRNPPFRTRLGRVLPRGNPRFDGHHIPILDTGSQN
jgi:probable HAF family extracellular repeat protein